MSGDTSLLPRSLAPVVQEALNDTPVVCLLGPRQSGKTTLARQLAPDRAFVSLDEHNYYRTPWRTRPASSPACRTKSPWTKCSGSRSCSPPSRAVDRDRRPGRFLLTGSANLLLLPTVTESLAGRMEIASCIR